MIMPAIANPRLWPLSRLDLFKAKIETTNPAKLKKKARTKPTIAKLFCWGWLMIGAGWGVAGTVGGDSKDGGWGFLLGCTHDRLQLGLRAHLIVIDRL